MVADRLENDVADIIKGQVENGVGFAELPAMMISAGWLEELIRMPDDSIFRKSLESKKRDLDTYIEAATWGRIHGQVNSNGAKTGRMSHFKPNLASVSKDKNIRALFVAKSGYKMVGVDAKALELRMLAHYMTDEEYIEEIIHGDIHEANRMAIGVQSRDEAKRFIFALIYGAGDKRLGQIVGRNSRVGGGLKKQFEDNTPAFKDLRERVDGASAKGWINGLDRRRLEIDKPYKALNILLQSAGAIVMKRALVILNDSAKEAGIDFKFVLNVHDEIQTEVIEDRAEEFGKLAVTAIVEAGEYYKLKCPMDAEYKVGENWSHTH